MSAGSNLTLYHPVASSVYRIFMFLLWVVNTSVVGDKANRNAFDDNPYPTIDPVMPIPSCLDDVYTRSPPCWDFWYTPNNSDAVEVGAGCRRSQPAQAAVAPGGELRPPFCRA